MKTARVNGKFLIKQKETENKSQNIIFISKVRRFNLDTLLLYIFVSGIREKKIPLLSSFKRDFYALFHIKKKIFYSSQQLK